MQSLNHNHHHVNKDGRRRTPPYVPADIASLEDERLSDAGFRFLLAIRRECDIRESDGVISKRQLKAVATSLGFEQRTAKLTSHLAETGYLTPSGDDGYVETHFLKHCRSRETREELRTKWVERKRSAKASTVESPVESTVELQ